MGAGAVSKLVQVARGELAAQDAVAAGHARHEVLLHVCAGGHVDALKEMAPREDEVQRGGVVEVAGGEEHTPLTVAVRGGHLDAVCQLVNLLPRTVPTTAGEHGDPLRWAVVHLAQPEHAPVFKVLAAHYTETQAHRILRTPDTFACACARGNAVAVLTLLAWCRAEDLRGHASPLPALATALHDGLLPSDDLYDLCAQLIEVLLGFDRADAAVVEDLSLRERRPPPGSWHVLRAGAHSSSSSSSSSSSKGRASEVRVERALVDTTTVDAIRALCARTRLRHLSLRGCVSLDWHAVLSALVKLPLQRLVTLNMEGCRLLPAEAETAARIVEGVLAEDLAVAYGEHGMPTYPERAHAAVRYLHLRAHTFGIPFRERVDPEIVLDDAPLPEAEHAPLGWPWVTGLTHLRLLHRYCLQAHRPGDDAVAARLACAIALLDTVGQRTRADKLRSYGALAHILVLREVPATATRPCPDAFATDEIRDVAARLLERIGEDPALVSDMPYSPHSPVDS